MVMASLISAPTSLYLSSRTSKSPIYTLPSLFPKSKTPKFHLFTWFPQLGHSLFSPWSGLKHLGISRTPRSPKIERKERCKGRVVHASLFGVGAPEALVIGVVALLVFGPKGLAEVARNLGKTLREFQPTIRELQDVSREFKNTLEREIGLDDISSSTQNTYTPNKANTASTPPSVVGTENSQTANTASTPAPVVSTENSQTVSDPNGAPSPNRAYTSEEYLKVTEEQLKASAVQQQEQTPPPEKSQLEPLTQPQATVQETAAGVPPPQKPESET